MADIRLISILPPQPAQGIAQPPQVAQGGSSPQPGLPANLPTGTVLTGFIVNRDAGGNPVLRSDSGDVVFSSDVFLKIGSEVVLRIENRAGSTLAHLLSVNGQAPEVAAAQSAFAEIPEVIVSSNLGTATATPASSQSTAAQMAIASQGPAISVNATLLSAPAPQENAPPPLAPGAQLTLKVISLSEPAPFTAALPSSIAPPGKSAPPNQLSAGFYAAYARSAGTAVPVTPPATPTGTATNTAQPSVASTPIAPPLQTAAAPTAIPAGGAPATPAAVMAPNVATVAEVAAPAVASSPPTPAPGQILTATVIGSEPTGEALVQSPIGIIRLQPGTVLPTGSVVTFEIGRIVPAETAQKEAAATAAATPLPALARQWTTLEQIVALLSDRIGASGFMSDSPPWSPGNLPTLVAPSPAHAMPLAQQISTGLLFFIAALRGSDFTKWLGKNNTQWLEDQGHGDLVKKASGEFSAIARQFNEPGQQPWQSLFFPLAVEGGWQQVRMFVKRDRKKPATARARADEDTRFVVEMELSQLGEMQLDGLVRRQENKVEFDLYIRSLAPLDEGMQQDIAAIYNQMGQLTGYQGSVIFQAGKEFPLHPMEEVLAHAMRAVLA